MTAQHDTYETSQRPRYFRTAFPAEFGEHGAGIWYAEFVDGVPRRQFEVYADRVLVAPYDLLFADQYDTMLEDEHYVEITLAEFEKAFDEFATKRFREIGEGHA